MNRSSMLACIALIALAAAVTLLAYPQLPARIPIHWNAQGRIDGYGPPWMLFVLGPGVMIVMTLLFAVIPWLSPRKFEIAGFSGTYGLLAVLLVALFAYVNLLLVAAAMGFGLDTARAILGGVAILIILMGNVMGRVRRNFYVGIRTPWALADERVWYATHRFAAWTMVAGGIVALAVVAASGPLWAWMAAILGGVMAPALYSLVYYKNLEARGEL